MEKPIRVRGPVRNQQKDSEFTAGSNHLLPWLRPRMAVPAANPEIVAIRNYGAVAPTAKHFLSDHTQSQHLYVDLTQEKPKVKRQNISLFAYLRK